MKIISSKFISKTTSNHKTITHLENEQKKHL